MSNHTASLGAGNGVTYGYNGDNKTILGAMLAFTAIAWYNAAEILVLIFFVFKKYSGLYFWSLLVTSFSVIPYALGAWMKLTQVTSIQWISVSFLTWGWVVMITGQSLVLWSRLHLITQNRALLRFILWLIIVDTIVLCTPTMVLTYGSNTSRAERFVHGYMIMEKIQMTWFTLQEFFISGVYLVEIRKLFKVIYDGGTRKLMWQLVLMNCFIIFLDLAMLVTEYFNLYEIESTVKGVIYSVKLKVEFGVLSKIVNVVTNQNDSNRLTIGGIKDSIDHDIERLPSIMSSPSQMSRPKQSTSISWPHDDTIIEKDHASPQSNLPAEWRLSQRGQSIYTQPTLLEALHDNSRRTSASSASSIDDMYPGRLSS